MTTASTGLFLLVVGLGACEQGGDTVSPGVIKELFDTTPEGQTVHRFTLTNANGVRIRAISYGGIITSLETPDRHGEMADIVLGFHDLQGYLEASPYFGAIVGRYGNRIAGGRFELGGEEFVLARNDGANHLHGGLRGFDKVVWEGETFGTEHGVGVVFRYTSPDGEEGYPGTLEVEVTYTLTDADELVVDYFATADRATPVNLTQHSYFNLAGHGAGDVLDHELRIPAERFTPVDETLIPMGELAAVDGTPFDFRTALSIGSRIDAQDEQLGFGGGYDHNFVLDGTPAEKGQGGAETGAGGVWAEGTSADSEGLVLAAEVFEPSSGRTLQILTEEPGVQFYSGNFLDGTISGKDGVVYQYRAGFCLETQHFPDSPNQVEFPSTILHPGDEYRSRTIFRFGIG
jgi:aldose 1-epimerase